MVSAKEGTSTIHSILRFDKQTVLLGAAAVIGLSLVGTAMFRWGRPLAVVLAVQVVMFFIAFHRPVWAMAALIVGQLTASNYMISLATGTQVSVRFLWTVMAISLLIPMLQKGGGIRLGDKARRVIIPAVIFCCVATISNVVNVGLSYSLEYLRQIATMLAILVLLPAVVRKESDLKLLALVALITSSISAMVGVMQHYRPSGLPVYTLYRIGLQSRVIGLTESPVILGFGLPLALLPTISMFFLKGVGPRARQLLVLLALVMAAALYFTLTRSGIYSVALGLLAMIILMKGKAKRDLFLIVLILGAAFLFYTDAQQNRYSGGFTTEKSATGRLVLWEAGARIALDYPLLGIGGGRFQEISAAYSSVINPRSLEMMQALTGRETTSLGTDAPHNDFTRVWLSFGTPALLAYLWVFAGIFRNFLDAYRQSRSRFLKGLALGGFAAMTSYVLNAFSHNVMDTVYLLWILGGLSIAVTKVTLAQQRARARGLR